MSKIQPKQIDLYTDPNFTSSSDQLIPSQKATKIYVNTQIQSNKYHALLISGQNSYDVIHNMNNYYLSIDVWTVSGIIPVEKIYPQILIIDSNTVRINFNSATTEDTMMVIKA